jgi:hypothetical protein
VEVPQKEIPALGHVEIIDEAVESTCSEVGHTEGSHCETCGEVLKVPEELPLKEHESVKVKAEPATCQKEGRTAGTVCKLCGTTLSGRNRIKKTDHTPKTVPGKPATCLKTGISDGSVCSVCGKTLKEQETLPKSDHTPKVIPATEATCTEPAFSEGSECRDCGTILKQQKRLGSPLGHDYSENKCTRCGERCWTASFSSSNVGLNRNINIYVTLRSANSSGSVSVYDVGYFVPDGGEAGAKHRSNWSGAYGHGDQEAATWGPYTTPGTLYYSVYDAKSGGLIGSYSVKIG